MSAVYVLVAFARTRRSLGPSHPGGSSPQPRFAPHLSNLAPGLGAGPWGLAGTSTRPSPVW